MEKSPDYKGSQKFYYTGKKKGKREREQKNNVKRGILSNDWFVLPTIICVVHLRTHRRPRTSDAT